jgi:SLA1 homology domain 1, SHD1
MKGCAKNFLAAIVLVVIAVIWITSCNRAETERRAKLTPEERKAEDGAASKKKADDEKASQRDDLNASASVMAKDYVLKFLKHPDDASFGLWSVPEVRTNEDQSVFYVESTVKAKNDFGGELTYRWAVILRRVQDSQANQWTLVSCAIDDKIVYADAQAADQLQRGKASKELEEQQVANKARAEAKAEAERIKRMEIDERKWRTWTSNDAKHSTDAKFDGLTSGTVKLIKRDGSSVKVPLDKLSDADQKFIAKRGWEK